MTKFPFYYKANLKLNKLRVHYFFSLTKDINTILKDLSIDIRITDTEDRLIFTGRSMPLHKFVADHRSFNTIVLPKSISLFSSDINEHITLQVI